MMVQRLLRMLMLRVGQAVAPTPTTPRITIRRTLKFTRTIRRDLRF